MSTSSEEKIAALVVEYLLASAGGMVDQRNSDSKDKREDKESTGKGGKSLDAIFAAFETKLFAMLAPAALVASMLASTASGLSVFIGAVKILGSVLGMILAPGIMLLSAVILSIAQVIQEALLPNLEDWYTAVITFGLGAIDFLESCFVNAANTIIDFVVAVVKAGVEVYKTAAIMTMVYGMLQHAMGNEAGAAKSGQDAIAMIRKSAEMSQSGDTQKMTKRVLSTLGIEVDENGKPKGMANTGGFGDKVRKNLSTVVDQFQQENTPKSQQTGLSQAYFSAQTGALNFTPFERENLKMLMTIVETMREGIKKSQPPTTQ